MPLSQESVARNPSSRTICLVSLLKLPNANLSRGGTAAASLAGAAVGGGLGYAALPAYTMGTTGYHILKGLEDVSAAVPEHVKWMRENPIVVPAEQP